MGTNYYLITETKPACSCCGRGPDEEILHIGQSSAGWCFALRAYPERGLHSECDWRAAFETPSSRIENEYGEIILARDMILTITNRKFHARSLSKPYGYDSWDEFHRINHSEMGPNGLLRSRIDGVRCIAHGAGPWDMFMGEFS